MPGGYFQLIAQGPCDVYLTGNPSISFFKFVYRRHTQYSMELISLPFNVIPTFTTMQKTEAHCNIDRNGDLLHDCYLLYDLPAIYTEDIPFSWVDNVGNKIIDELSIKCDGQNLDRQFGEFMNCYKALTLTSTKKKKHEILVNGNTNINNIAFPNLTENLYPVLPGKRLLIPLPFWFCKNSGLSIPLIALQYTKLRIDVIYTRLNEIFKIGSPPISPVQMFTSDIDELSDENKAFRTQLIDEGWDQTNVFYRFAKGWDQYSTILANYIYLAEDERKKFAQTSHEYLITQLQRRIYLGLMRGPNKLELVLNHPIKELIWFLRRSDAYKENNWFNFTDNDCPQILDEIKDIRNLLINPCINRLIGKSDNGLEQLKNLSKDLTGQLYNDYNNLFNGKTLSVINNRKWDYYSIMKNAKLIFNGNDRFEIRDNTYFENEQVYKYHTGDGQKGLYVYSFSLKPEKEQPSGTCNMSRIKKQEFSINIFDTDNTPFSNDKFDLHFFAINYNVFRIMGGIGQIVFSN